MSRNMTAKCSGVVRVIERLFSAAQPGCSASLPVSLATLKPWNNSPPWYKERKFFAIIGADIVGKRIGPVDVTKKSLHTCSQRVALILGPLVTVYETVTYTQSVGTRGLRFLQLSEMDVRFGEQS
jgi:hypothetical protein